MRINSAYGEHTIKILKITFKIDLWKDSELSYIKLRKGNLVSRIWPRNKLRINSLDIR